MRNSIPSSEGALNSRRYIANADDRPADEVERADAALAALAVQHLSAGTATEVYIYTTDIAAGERATYWRLWFGLQYHLETVEREETVGNGVLATVRWYDGEPVGDGHPQGQFAALKAAT